MEIAIAKVITRIRDRKRAGPSVVRSIGIGAVALSHGVRILESIERLRRLDLHENVSFYKCSAGAVDILTLSLELRNVNENCGHPGCEGATNIQWPIPWPL